MAESQHEPRLTPTAVNVLQVLPADPARAVYGLETCADVALPSGTVHPILERLQAGRVSAGDDRAGGTCR